MGQRCVTQFPEIPFSEMVAKSKGAKVTCNGREAGGVTFTEQGRRLGENPSNNHCSSLPCLCKYISNSCADFQLDQETAPGDLPGGPVVKNLPSNAGDAGLIPGQGTKIPRAAGQLNPHATTTELMCLN